MSGALLGLLFAAAALLYAAAGFGGGSSYLALLVLWDLPYSAIPVIALTCNIVVVSGNSFHYARAGYLRRRLLLPLAAASVPMAYIGGRIAIAKETFVLLLFISLLATGLRLLVRHRSYDDGDQGRYRELPVWLGALTGAALGFLAGVTGIGGGIFLSPVLYCLRAGSPRQIAAAASLFILVNSIAGIIGQWHKAVPADVALAYWHLPLLAFAGGQIGNLIVVKYLPGRIIALLTALLVLCAAGQLGMRLWGG